MKFAMHVAVLGALATHVTARCNNDCNNHGVCNAGSSCECERGFLGNDCAERLCYFGESFIDSPLGDLNADQTIDTDQQIHFHHSNAPVGEQYDPHYGLARSDNTAAWDEGHFYRECSNKGTCNRATGECECFPGFEGAGCTRQTCPDDCNGHGQCVGAEFSNSGYLAWDLTHTQKCVCDPGYSGPSCSMRKCPVGVDPISTVYVDTSSVWKIEFLAVGDGSSTTLYDGDKYMPDGPVHWTMTYTDEMGDEWTSSAVTSYYQAHCGGSIGDTDDVDAVCQSYPYVTNPRNDPDDDTTAIDVTTGADLVTAFYGDSSFTFGSAFIAEQVNASIAALPNDVARDAYVWVTHVPSDSSDDTNYLIYPSNGVPSIPTDTVDDCSSAVANCDHQDAFSQGASLAVNDAQFRFPYFQDLTSSTGLNASEVSNCGDESVCVFIKLPIAAGTQSIDVSYKYKTEIRSSGALGGHYSEVTGHSDDDIVEVSEVGSDRFWSINTDGTPSIAYESNTELHACSRRGLCDYETGLCECFSGYSGYKCDQRSILGY